LQSLALYGPEGWATALESNGLHSEPAKYNREMSFPGFPPEALVFFRGLARNNRREWFQPRKPIFEEKVKRPMIELVERLNADLRKFAPEFVTDPEKAVYRIYRDVRFSADKKPYKDHIAASFHGRGGANSGGYYLAMSHQNVAVGGGIYMPSPAELLAIRTVIAERHEEFRRILRAAAVRKLLGEMHGEQLSRTPKGFPPDHPAADLLKFKRFILYVELAPELATTPKMYAEVLQRFKAMKPFIDFLRAAAKPKNKRGTGDRFLSSVSF
jgi:uncharacterized protein (TIGR02453 family)